MMHKPPLSLLGEAVDPIGMGTDPGKQARPWLKAEEEAGEMILKISIDYTCSPASQPQ
jgi:hypothetical protein